MAIENVGKEKLDGTRQSVLPAAPVDYARRYQDDLNNLLRLYFTQIDNLTASLLDRAGTRFFSTPYAAFQNNVTISAALANTAYAMPFGTFDYGNGVSIVSTSRITVEFAGVYNFQFSAQLANSSTSVIGDVSIWLAKNGTNVVESNTLITVPTQHGGVPGYAVAAWNLPVRLQAGEYIELMWSTTSTTVTIPYIPAQTSPTRPETPAVIGTLTYLSRL